MIRLTFGQQALLITIPLLTLVASNHADAEIYKWRDNRGVTQYSDRPPVSSFSKTTPNELVNSLQTKDLCAVGPIKKNIASTTTSTKDYSGFFSTFGNNSAKTRSTNLTALSTNNRTASSTSTTGTAKPVTNQYSPLSFVSDSKKVTTSGSPILTWKSSSNGKPPKASAKPTPVPPPVVTEPLPETTVPETSVPPVTTSPDTPSNIIQTGLMPAVDISKNIIAAEGWSDLRIRPNIGPQDIPPIGDGHGQFRIDCDVSHMSNDDPILYPNQQGAAHHHTFFGNTSVNYKSNVMTLSTTGNSTCRGGIANRSAYWVPSMIDTATKTALKPTSALWYYKTGYSVPKSVITAPPKGLRMISGNMKATSATTSREVTYNCFLEGQPSTSSKNIPACKQGWTIVTHVAFPQCWDGKNLDSPDHYSHMAYPSGGSCPATHPVAIPEIILNTKYLVTSAEGTKNWRLSSDNYAVNDYNAGYSGHGDWINGWDENVIAGIVKNCLNAGKDCGSHMLGDGTVLYGANRDF